MTHHTPLLNLVEGFLSRTKMGEAYFGKKAVGNSELVSRLRAGGSVLVTTDAKVREFIKEHSPSLESDGSLACPSDVVAPETDCKGIDA